MKSLGGKLESWGESFPLPSTVDETLQVSRRHKKIITIEYTVKIQAPKPVTQVQYYSREVGCFIVSTYTSFQNSLIH